MDETQVKVTINGKEAEDELNRLRKDADAFKKSMLEAYKAGNNEAAHAFNKELKRTEQQIRRNESGVKAVTRVMNQLNRATPSELNKALKHLQSELKTIERGTPAWDSHVQKIRLVKAEIDKVNAEMRQSESLLVRMKNKVNDWGTVAMGAVGAVTGLVLAGKKAVNTYASMQQEEANVRKYTGMTAEEVDRLNEAFKKMDTRTSREELNKLAQEAGRLGMQSEEDVLGFVKAADKINVALDDLGDGATLTLSKLTDIFGDRQRLGTEKSLLAVGSVINELSQNCTASAPYLAEFGQRLAGVGSQANMTIPEIMGFGAVLDAQGKNLEMSATALSKVIMNMFKNPEKIAKATGMSIEQFSETCKRSTNEGLMMLFNRLHELGGIDSLAPVFADMGENGARASEVLAALAGNIEMVRLQQEAANVAFQEATSIDKEFEVQNTTVQAGLEKARKGFVEMSVTLGKELMPVVSHILSGTSATMRLMLKIIQFVKEHRIALMSLAAAVTAYTVAVNLALIKEKIHAAVVAVKTAAMHVHKVAVLAASAAYNALTGNTVRANAAMKLLNKTMLLNPWAALVAAVLAASVALVAFVKKRNEATLLEKTEADAQKEISKQYTEQKSKIDMLKDAVHDETLSLKAREKALKELKGIVPEYHASLTNEGKLINDNADAIENYTDKLEKQIRMQVYKEKLMELYQKKMQAEENETYWQAELDKAKQEALKHAGEIQMRTSMGAAGPTGGSENSYSLNVRVKTENFEGAKKQLNEVNAAIDAIKKKVGDGGLLEEITGGGNNASVSGAKSASSGGEVDELKERLKKLDEMRARIQAQDKVAYLQGKKNFQEYTQANIETDIAYYHARMKLLDANSTEYLQAEAAKLEAEKKLKQNANGQSVQGEQMRYSEEKAAANQRYADGKISAKVYQLELERMELTHLKNLVNIYDEGSEERLKAQEKYNQTSLKYQQKHAEESKRLQEQVQKAYFDMQELGMPASQEGYADEKAALDAVYDELSKHAMTNEQKLQLDEAYEQAKFELAKNYNDETGMAEIDRAQATYEKMTSLFQSKGAKKFISAFSVMTDGLSNLFSGVTDLISAETDLQTAQIEKRYEAEIAAAGENKALVERLEQQKQSEVSKVKTEAADKEFKMNIFSAIAQGALAAINAWNSGVGAGFPAGLVLGPMMLAMSLAATGVQIAAMKKQHDAAMAQGYAAGGYTMPGRKYQPAGIVHAGEWVASQELLANPAAAATIAQLDYAQRTNTIGQLRPARTVNAAQEEVIAPERRATYTRNSESADISESINRLNRTLDNGIYAATLVTGDKGILRQQRKYEQLMRNKSGR